MFARSMLRSAAPLKTSAQGFRGYASKPTSGGGIGAAGYAAIAAVAGGGGYYYYANVQGKAPPVQDIANAAKEKASGSVTKPSGPAPKAFTGGDQGFLSLKLDKIEDINHNTKKFIFALPEADQVSGLTVASALITKFQAEGMEKPCIRPYTPTSDEDKKGLLELIIKKYPEGVMSKHVHDLKVGDTLDIKGPIPKYPMAPNKHAQIALIAGGTGITPMYQIVRNAFKNPEDKTKITLVFANVTQEDILLKKEFDELENTYPQRFRAFYVLDKPPQEWKQGKGYITKDLLKTILPEPKEENIKIFVCGPPPMYKSISGAKKSPSDQGELGGALKELGYSKDQVYKF